MFAEFVPSKAELYVCSEVPPLSWEEFTRTHPVGSIALDGYVSGGPKFDAEGPYLNANHHEEVNRLATLSTAQQILMNTQMGMAKAFMQDGVFAPNVYVNDCDQDVCAAWFLLDNISQVMYPSPSLNRFIQIAGTLDATAGAFPYEPSIMPILREIVWVFEPYTRFRASGEMAKKDNDQYRSVIQSVEERIQEHVLGRGESARLDTKYKVVGGGKDWKMIVEEGMDGRVGALIDGIDAYVSVQELEDERWRYTIGRRSEFIDFDVPGLLNRLNEAEGCTEDRRGGATIIAGSPRVGASKLSPQEVEHIINEFLEAES